MLNFAAMSDRMKPLTAVEKAEAKRLKALFNQNKLRLGLTQEKLGELMGVGQSAISHWLNGTKRISDLTLLRFASLLQFDPDQVRPGCLDRLPRIDSTYSLSDRAVMFAKAFDALSEADQEFVLSVLERVRH